MNQRVLLPTDGSTEAEQAAAHAFDRAEGDGGALHVLSVVNPATLGPDVRTAAIIEPLKESAQTAVDELVTRAKEYGIADVTGEVMTGTPHQAIIEYATEHDIDVIVMSTHGRSGLSRYFLGSITEKVVRSADIPVLTVPIPEELGDDT